MSESLLCDRHMPGTRETVGAEQATLLLLVGAADTDGLATQRLLPCDEQNQQVTVKSKRAGWEEGVPKARDQQTGKNMSL